MAWLGNWELGSREGVCECVTATSLLGFVLFSSGTRRAPTTGWWQGSRAATSSQCWIGSGNFTAVAIARDARILAGEPTAKSNFS